MAFGKKTAAPAVPLSAEEKVARHISLAEQELASANKAGRLDAQTVHAARATAHATLATSYLGMVELKDRRDATRRSLAVAPGQEIRPIVTNESEARDLITVGEERLVEMRHRLDERLAELKNPGSSLNETNQS